ncbi:MAG TPA: HDIG domain-containing protein [Candidatus Portnoybacteria bacterium]|jgi:uncharacterized protein|nr:HDIG domain-containing protein [Candidatus Portnoybacteria bacterium]MDD5752048.1 HDIG domain-containing protein [Candidatus Portnoybacteria bacterium]HOZ16398.1 HDIG domain-containing protein [Candidatus Portnoybacteria bacterium]HPH52052.1 HDIG domain-containing protein [Candidatus Portnoybacteria bacterium]HPJ80201.1 HDIG domain-containing protein [Candidatus Portnoybacteria bacterium]
MNREEAFKLIQEKIQNQNLIKHCLAVEACMKEFAAHFNEHPAFGGTSIEKWGLAGLLHDIDYELTKDNLQQHSIIGAEMLEKSGLDKEICDAVRTHNEMHGIKPETLMAKVLLPVDPLTGLIIASTLVLPSKKIIDVTAENILNRFKEKGFAKGASREIISKCSETGLTLEQFVEIGLEAMKGIAGKLGL